MFQAPRKWLWLQEPSYTSLSHIRSRSCGWDICSSVHFPLSFLTVSSSGSCKPHSSSSESNIRSAFESSPPRTHLHRQGEMCVTPGPTDSGLIHGAAVPAVICHRKMPGFRSSVAFLAELIHGLVHHHIFLPNPEIGPLLFCFRRRQVEIEVSLGGGFGGLQRMKKTQFPSWFQAPLKPEDLNLGLYDNPT